MKGSTRHDENFLLFKQLIREGKVIEEGIPLSINLGEDIERALRAVASDPLNLIKRVREKGALAVESTCRAHEVINALITTVSFEGRYSGPSDISAPTIAAEMRI